MNKTMVGVFQNASEAQRAVQSLTQQGVGQGDVTVLSSEQVDNLGRLGLPAATLSAYSAALRSGKVLVVIRASEDRLEHLSNAMGQFQTVDLGQQGAQQEVVLPVVEEELQVGKREVQRGGVRVYTHMVERPVEETVRLREEHVTVQRHPVDRPVTAADTAAFQEIQFEVRQSAEEVVVAKQARVVEEVVIGKSVTERSETVRDTLKRTDVQVEQLPGQRPSQDRYAAYDTGFRQHYASAFAQSGYTYDQVSPAYRYGYNLRERDEYRGRDWSGIEADARRSWEERNPGTWDRIKDAVRHAWESTKAAVSGDDTNNDQRQTAQT